MAMVRKTQLLCQYPQTPPALLALFLAYVLYVYLQVGVRVPMLGAFRLELVLGAILGPLALVRYLSSPITGGQAVRGWAIALLLAMAIMVPFSKFPAESWSIFVDRGLKFSVYGLCIAGVVSSPRDLRWFIGAFLLAFLKMGQEGFLGTLDGSMIWEEQEIPRLRGPTPSYNHPNSFSGTQLGTLPFLFYIFPLLPWYWRAVVFVQTIFCGNVILRTGSRTGYLGFLTGVAAMVWLTKSKVKTLLIVALVGISVIPLVPRDYMERFESIFTDKSTAGEDTSVGQRKEILVDATKIFLDHPFGIGVGAFPLVRKEIFGRVQDTHNLYLEVATNIGVQGFVIFIGLVLVMSVSLWRLQKRLSKQVDALDRVEQKGEEAQCHIADVKFVLACTRATFVFLMIRLVLGAFGMDLYEIYWWFVAGLTVAMIRIEVVAAQKTAQLLEPKVGIGIDAPQDVRIVRKAR